MKSNILIRISITYLKFFFKVIRYR